MEVGWKCALILNLFRRPSGNWVRTCGRPILNGNLSLDNVDQRFTASGEGKCQECNLGSETNRST